MLTGAVLTAATGAAARLRARGENVAVAESSTGGLIAAALVAQDGASRYFRDGFGFYTLSRAASPESGSSIRPIVFSPIQRRRPARSPRVRLMTSSQTPTAAHSATPPPSSAEPRGERDRSGRYLLRNLAGRQPRSLEVCAQ